MRIICTKITSHRALRSLLIILTISSFLTGCSFFKPYKAPLTQGTVINQEAISLLQPGLTMEQVQQLLGPPLGQDPYDPRHWEYVFYTTDKTFHPDAIRHLIVNFDSDAYLKDWEVINKLGSKKKQS